MKKTLLFALLFTGFAAIAQWNPIGQTDFAQISSLRASYTRVVLNHANIPYVVFFEALDGGKCHVRRYVNGLWEVVGEDPVSSGYAMAPTIAFDNSDNVYIGYADSDTNRAMVKKLIGNSWTVVGPAATMSEAQSQNVIIRIDNNNVPYILFSDLGVAGKLTVRKFDGSNWVNVGTPGFTETQTYGDLDFSSDNIPYVAYSNTGGKANVKKLTGNAWTTVGTADFSAAEAPYICLRLDNNDVPYVGYMDESNSLEKGTVKKLNGSVWATVGTVGFTASRADEMVLRFDTANMPFFGYNDHAGDNIKATVKKFTGTNWVTVGTTSFSPEVTDHSFSFDMDSNNVPYVALSEYSTMSIYPAIVMKYTGTNWTEVGNRGGFSEGPANYLDITLDSVNKPYAVYMDGNTSNKASVKKFNGTSWETVGAKGFSSGSVEYTAIALTNANVPYVVYKDVNISNKATVKKFDGTSWITVGTQGFSTGSAKYTSIAIDENDVVYVAYSDGGSSDKVTVKKFNGTAWVTVGTEGFSATFANFISLAIDNANIPYVVYSDGNSSYKATVKKFNGTSWVTVGTAGFSANGINLAKIHIDNLNVPYVAYKDSNTGKPTVKKFNGTAWVSVGADGFSTGSILSLSMDLSNANVPYVVYSDTGNSGKSTLKKFDGSNWVEVGTSGHSKEKVTNTVVAIGSNNYPYVAYTSRDAFAKYFGTTLSVEENIMAQNKIILAPNPVRNTLTVWGANVQGIEIFDMLGKSVFQNLNGKNSWEIGFLQKGMYFAKIKSELGITTLKFIKE